MALTHQPHEHRLMEAIIGRSLPAEDHLLACAACRAERDRIESSFRSFAQSARAASDRPGYFWTRQSAQIHERLGSSSRSAFGYGSRMASALALLALTAFLLLQGAPKPLPDSSQVVAVSDHEILLEVERALDRDTPNALEPVTLLVEDMSRNSAQNSRTFSKELIRHDN